MYDFIAATERSGPALRSAWTSAARASGLSATLVRATTRRLAASAPATTASRSGEAPDWERTSGTTVERPSTVVTDGRASTTRRPSSAAARYVP